MRADYVYNKGLKSNGREHAFPRQSGDSLAAEAECMYAADCDDIDEKLSDRTCVSATPSQYLDCTSLESGDSVSNSDMLHQCFSICKASPIAKALAEHAMRSDWSISVEALQEYDYLMDSKTRKIIFDQPIRLSRSSSFTAVCKGDIALDTYEHSEDFWGFFINFVKGLREIWQEDHKSYDCSKYGPEEFLALERVRSADVDTIAVMIGWELRTAGCTLLWHTFLASDLGDMALTFSQTIDKDAKAYFSGKASAKAFWQWHCDDKRVDSSDHLALEILDMYLRDPASAGEKEESEQAFADNNTCSYEKCLENLSTLPDGQRYLRGCAENIKSDPHFSGLSHAVNQAHLFQIVYDFHVVRAGPVAFRDASLAAKIFPKESLQRI